MADSDGRMFTEGETYALVDEAVKRETAALATSTESLNREKAELQGAIDVLATEKAAAVERAEAAEKALEDFKAEIETQKAREALRESRTKAFAEVAPQLELTEERVERLLAYTDEQFEAHIADLREVAAKKPAVNDGDADDKDAKGKKQKAGDVPRESAALKGESGSDSAATTPVVGLFGAARAMKA